MTGLYGNRSIIPNNYYFTFDYIYDKEADLDDNDGILIGRCVLAKAESTVHLKTVGGYIRVAKLDNEGRFALSEGYSLTETDDIDLLTGCGLTPNGDGLYVVDFDTVSKAIKIDGSIGDTYHFTDYGQSDDTKNEKEIGHGHWPHIRGQVDEEYLAGRTFLLRQISSIQPVLNKDGEANDGIELTPVGSADDFSSGITYYYSTDGKTYTPKVLTKTNISELSSSEISKYYTVTAFTVKLYQTLTDITATGVEDMDNMNRKSLNHKNKTFYRSIDAIFTSVDNDNSYLKDNKQIGNISYFKLNDKNQFEGKASGTTGLYVIKNIYAPYYVQCTNESIYDFTTKYYQKNTDDTYEEIIISEKDFNSHKDNYYTYNFWSDWYDITETYTGYIGDLNPTTEGNGLDTTELNCAKIDDDGNVIGCLPYNKYNVYYNDDDIKVKIDETVYYANPSDFYIKSESKRNNLSDDSNLVEAINSLDEILGSHSRIGQKVTQNGTVNVVSAGSLDSKLDNDKRTYNIPEGNVMDALVHHDADIGAIEGVNTKNTYNLNFSTVDLKENEAAVDGTNLSRSNTDISTINSLTAAIKKLDNAIGSQNRLTKTTVNAAGQDSGKANTVTGTGANDADTRAFNIPETNLVDAIIHHDADIGAIESVGISEEEEIITNEDGSEDTLTLKDTYNVQFSSTGSATNIGKEATDRATIHSLTDFARKLDSALGSQARLASSSQVNSRGDEHNSVTGTGAQGDVRNYSIMETNAIDALVKLAADVGTLSNINSDNLIFSNTINSSQAMNTANRAEIVSLSDAIQHLSQNIIGDIVSSFITEPNNLDSDFTVVDNIKLLNTAIGDIAKILEDNENYLGGDETLGLLSDNNNSSLSSKLNYLLKELIGYRSSYTTNYNGISSENSLVTNLDNLNIKIGDLNKGNYTSTSKLNKNSSTLIQAINYIVNNLIGEMTDSSNEDGLQPTLQTQIDVCEANINILSENLNMTDIILDQIKLNMENNSYINWQYLD